MRKPNSGNGSHSPLRALYGRHRKHVPFRRFYNFCRNILYKQRVDQDLAQEIRSYLDLPNRRAKFYRLTKLGRRQLDAETEQWERISLAIASEIRSHCS